MQSSNSYNINFSTLASWLVPKAMRKTKLLILVKACLFPLFAAHNAFMQYRKAKLYQIMISPQVCYLERLLNDRFDFTQRRIRIKDAVWHLPLFIFQKEELKPVPIYLRAENSPQFIYTKGEAGNALNDFVILVPAGLPFIESEMRAAVDQYKLFGTTYTIQTN